MVVGVLMLSCRGEGGSRVADGAVQRWVNKRSCSCVGLNLTNYSPLLHMRQRAGALGLRAAPSSCLGRTSQEQTWFVFGVECTEHTARAHDDACADRCDFIVMEDKEGVHQSFISQLLYLLNSSHGAAAYPSMQSEYSAHPAPACVCISSPWLISHSVQQTARKYGWQTRIHYLQWIDLQMSFNQLFEWRLWSIIISVI